MYNGLKFKKKKTQKLHAILVLILYYDQNTRFD